MLTLSLLVALGGILFILVKRDTFGKTPTGNRLKRIHQSPHFKKGSFQNLTESPVLLKGTSYFKMIADQLNKPIGTKPSKAIPSVKTDLKNLKANTPTIIWFGHSSYLIMAERFNILVDPVMKGNASPFSFFGKPFDGTDTYALTDLPLIDLVLLTHDHYDHLHYESIRQMATTAGHFCTSLGVGAHLEYWGVPQEKITELDWWQSASFENRISLTAVPARHFSGRTFKRGQTLWSGFVLKVDGYNLFLGGDSGYENHFKEIGEKLGPFDLALLECGQYGKNWPYIHMLPEETAQAAQDLKAKVLMPIHWAKFELSMHEWNEPIERVVNAAQKINQPITTPMIGEPVIIHSVYPNKMWWI
ncbi:MAG: MBL fold metallo-hydrolase [Bacteroidetes bacterium]|nr:MBL fold metallo-hydrolase [Bacteroidota bacterium]MBS1540239.1 MBL fold metallo-hydrolase [Bacteroidota bacterium]